MLKQFYIGVKSVVRVEDKILLLKKTDKEGHRFWDLPGGRIDDSESIEETLTRELKEEVPSIGTFTVDNILSAYRLPHDLKDGAGLVFLYYRINAESFDVELSDEHEAYRWVSETDISTLENDPDATLITGIRDAILAAFH